jgi:hypothetical protein
VRPDTPKHLAERIINSKAVVEGERKQVTVLFADPKGSMELLADRQSAVGDDQTGQATQTTQKAGEIWALPVDIDVRAEALEVNEVGRAVSIDLIGERDIPIPGEPRLGPVHAAIVAQRHGAATVERRGAGLSRGRGRLPFNTDGGGLCYNRPANRGGLTKVGEAVRQLRGEARPPAQVKNCDIALAHGTGGLLVTRHGGTTLIMGRSDA